MATRVSRRFFIRAVGGTSLGLAVGAYAGPADSRSGRAAFRPNGYLEILPDNSITFWLKKCEMGQQIHLAIAALVADELGADLDRIEFRQAPTLAAFGTVGTGGSYAVPGFWRFGRPLVAAARQMLEQAAARRWGVPVDEVHAAGGALWHRPSGRSASFGDLAAAAAALDVPSDPQLRDPASRRHVGSAAGRLDAEALLSGRAVFGMDLRRPGMRFAVLAKSPVRGGRLLSFDATDALATAGVEQVFDVNDAVAVVARNSWAALAGRKALRVEWDRGTDDGQDSDGIRRRLRAWSNAEAKLVRYEPGADPVGPELELEYEFPMAQHAAIEPVNATAEITAGRCTLWGPVQQATLVQDEVAAALGLPKSDVVVHTTLLGGSFGRKLERGFAVEAACVAAKAGCPVQLLYSRADDMMHGGVRPPSVHRFRLARTAGDDAYAMDYAYSAASTFAQQDPAQLEIHGYDWTAALGATDMPYAFRSLRVRQRDVDLPAVPFNWWRGTYRNNHAFAIECAMDEFALHLGVDPLGLRVALLTRDIRRETFPSEISEVHADRLRHVLETAAARGGYSKSGSAGRAVGLACHCYSDVSTYVAHAVDVSVDGNRVTIHKVVAVVDCGLAVVPDSVQAQMEGSVVFGLSAALWGDVEVGNSEIRSRDFAACRLMRNHEAPAIEVHIVDSPDAPGGMGEPPLPSVTPAFLNAVASAGGPRIRRLPAGNRLQLA